MTADVIAPALVVTEPGVYEMSTEQYHADPVPGGSLSRSWAKKLLPPSCPAKFAYEREHGQPTKKEFDFGNVAHKLVLGKGHDVVIVEKDSWRTDAAKEAAVKARKAGKIPILRHGYDKAQEMAEALRESRAAALFQRGEPEKALFWRDEQTGLMLRAQVDWLSRTDQLVMYVPDYKTAESAEPAKIERAVDNLRYGMQAAWTLDGIRTLRLHPNPVFLFVFQEREPPYIVTVAELTSTALDAGRHWMRQAIELFVQCSAEDRWPGYVDDVALIHMPPWSERAYFEEIS